MYEDLTEVNDLFQTLRDEVMKKKQPRRMFVQPVLEKIGESVVMVSFPATEEGMIESFVHRFAENGPLGDVTRHLLQECGLVEL